jgi:hypothetical protein
MLRQEASTACGGHDEEIGKNDAKTYTIKVYHGSEPLLSDVGKAARLIDESTSKNNERHTLMLGNVVTSLRELQTLGAALGDGKNERVTTLLGRAELELLRFIPRPGGEIEVIREDALDDAVKALKRPPRLLDRNQKQIAQLPYRWSNVYCAGLKTATTQVIASHTAVKKYTKEMETLAVSFPKGRIEFGDAAATSGGLSYDYGSGALRKQWESRPENECRDMHDVFCLFTVTMCLKFFYMWRKTTTYLKPVDDFLEQYRNTFATPKDPWAQRRLMDLCDEKDIVIAVGKLVRVKVDDDMRSACVDLMSTVSQFMNGVFCKYLERCDGLVTKIACMTGMGMDGKLADSALWAMYEDNEDVLWRLPVACAGHRILPNGAETLVVDWDNTVSQDDRRIEEGKQHLHGLVTEMCSNKRLSKEMEARLSGYIALAYAVPRKGGAMLTGQAVFGVNAERGEVSAVSAFDAKSTDFPQFFQAATTVSVGFGDVAVVTWCPSTAWRIANMPVPQGTKEVPDAYNELRDPLNTTPFGSLSKMQEMIENRLEDLGTKKFGTAQAHDFQRLYGLPGRLRGRVYNDENQQVYRITTWDDGVMLMIPEPWIQQCLWDFARCKIPGLHRRPFMGVVSSLGKARDDLKRAGMTNNWWLQHTNDPLAGLAVQWEERSVVGAESDSHANVWVLREDRRLAEIVLK